MGTCPRCRKVFGAHQTVGDEELPKVGDVSICIGCGTPLVLIGLPYEFRPLTPEDLELLDLGTKILLARAQYKITHRGERGTG